MTEPTYGKSQALEALPLMKAPKWPTRIYSVMFRDPEPDDSPFVRGPREASLIGQELCGYGPGQHDLLDALKSDPTLRQKLLGDTLERQMNSERMMGHDLGLKEGYENGRRDNNDHKYVRRGPSERPADASFIMLCRKSLACWNIKSFDTDFFVAGSELDKEWENPNYGVAWWAYLYVPPPLTPSMPFNYSLLNKTPETFNKDEAN